VRYPAFATRIAARFSRIDRRCRQKSAEHRREEADGRGRDAADGSREGRRPSCSPLMGPGPFATFLLEVIGAQHAPVRGPVMRPRRPPCAASRTFNEL
jgi:hypothetical protein